MQDVPNDLATLRARIRALPDDIRNAMMAAPLVEGLARHAAQDPEALWGLLEAWDRAGDIRGHWMAEGSAWESSYESFMGGAPDKEPPSNHNETLASDFHALVRAAIHDALRHHGRADLDPALIEALEAKGFAPA